MEKCISAFNWDEAVACITRCGADELNQQRYKIKTMQREMDHGNTILHLAIRYQAPARVLEAIFQAGFTSIHTVNSQSFHAAHYIQKDAEAADVIECCLRHSINVMFFHWVVIQYYHDPDWLGSSGRILRMMTRYGFMIERYFQFFNTRDPVVRFAKRVGVFIPMAAVIQHKRVGAKSALRVLPMELLCLLHLFI